MSLARPARISSDPDKYIRPCKGGKYRVRVWSKGRRYEIGVFPTKDAARVAIGKFKRGEIVAKPRFVKKIHTAEGVRFIAVVHVPDKDGTKHKDGTKRTIRVGDKYLTPQEAQGAAIKFLDKTVGEDARIAMMARG
jgi:hypothetical protein